MNQTAGLALVAIIVTVLEPPNSMPVSTTLVSANVLLDITASQVNDLLHLNIGYITLDNLKLETQNAKLLNFFCLIDIIKIIIIMIFIIVIIIISHLLQ